MWRVTCVEDLRLEALKRVPKMFYDYVDSGSWTEGTYRSNDRWGCLRDFFCAPSSSLLLSSLTLELPASIKLFLVAHVLGCFVLRLDNPFVYTDVLVTSY